MEFKQFGAFWLDRQSLEAEMLAFLQRNVENPRSNRKMLQYRHYKRVLRHLVAEMKALVKAHLFRWFSRFKTARKRIILGPNATCMKVDLL